MLAPIAFPYLDTRPWMKVGRQVGNHGVDPFTNATGMNGMSGVGGVGGLGSACDTNLSYSDLLSLYGVETCNQSTVGDQYACEQRNQPKLQALSDAQAAGKGCFNSDGSPVVGYGSGATTISTSGGTYVYSTSNAGGYRVGTFSFNNISTGGTATGNNNVGDTWKVSIVGSTPNAQVEVVGTHPNGATDSNIVGMTDSNGNFSIGGTFSNSDIGAWTGVWKTAGVVNGTVNFNVNAAVSVATSQGAVPPVATTLGGNTAPVGTGASAAVVAGSSIGSSISNALTSVTSATGISETELLVGAGAVVAFFMFMGKR